MSPQYSTPGWPISAVWVTWTLPSELSSLAASPEDGMREYHPSHQELRSLSCRTDAWLPTLIFKQTDGPRFKIGFITSWSAGVIAAILVPVIHMLQRRDLRMLREREVLDEISDSAYQIPANAGELDDKRSNTDLPESKNLKP
jgi:hypothetical protein